MTPFKFLQKPKPKDNILWNLDMDVALIAVINYKISRDIAMQHGDTELCQINFPVRNFTFPVRNCWLRIDRVVNWGSGNLEMVSIDYQLIELNNTSFRFTYTSELSVLMNRLTYD